jgi:uncharacterized membrane protein (DUF485 family)
MFYGDSTRALLLRAFVPLIIAAALINGWINTALLQHSRVNPAVIAALCAVVFAAVIGWIFQKFRLWSGDELTARKRRATLLRRNW